MDLSQYAGVPFLERGRSRAGVDCWGLVWLIYQEQFGVIIPSYEGRYADTRGAEIPGVIAAGAAAGCWRLLGDDEPSVLGDVIAFRIRGEPRHVGLALDNIQMLHVEWGTNVVRERFRSSVWNHRIVGRHRHREIERHAR